MNEALHVLASEVSSVTWYVPLVTPRGNAGKLGLVVAMTELPGGNTQQCMRAAAVALSKPAKVMSISRMWLTVSRLTTAVPVPGEAFDGDAADPVRSAL